ncbi:divalent-cation tolerance protein CutA [Thiohalocapsa marina]|uniref:Divalent-cation tolerance protein CutA n=1 Tax=Thiohalocapsa marina TaxID=424902 RepID=A0A5M8FPF5_9GAMM|nr:divalent-cation tolerance protein CutA [Thiohalocapsa marina]KAA6186364.1 divalent-cation tolerance protein CutA [Thiohalocapsa marina]
MSEAVRVVLCTCPDQDVAESIAESLVARRLAACVNILPGVMSVYRWQDVIEKEEEVQLLIKTTDERMAELVEQILFEHPYDVPEVIAPPAVDGHDAYLEWVRQCTRVQQ